MKRVLLGTAAALTLTVTSAAAAPGWYFGAAGGVNWLQDTNLPTAIATTLNTNFETGWAVTGSIGYARDDNFRGEFEIGYRHTSVDSINVPANVEGDMVQFSFMANALYDIPVDENFHMTVGGGVGVAEANLKASGGGVAILRKGTDNFNFAWQLIGGASYRVWGETDLFAEYHYFANDDHDVVTYPLGFPRRDSVDADNSTVFVGLRFGMGE